jgi:hypothetical protein
MSNADSHFTNQFLKMDVDVIKKLEGLLSIYTITHK